MLQVPKLFIHLASAPGEVFAVLVHVGQDLFGHRGRDVGNVQVAIDEREHKTLVVRGKGAFGDVKAGTSRVENHEWLRMGSVGFANELWEDVLDQEREDRLRRGVRISREVVRAGRMAKHVAQVQGLAPLGEVVADALTKRRVKVLFVEVCVVGVLKPRPVNSPAWQLKTGFSPICGSGRCSDARCLG